jgi:hypothetical protein
MGSIEEQLEEEHRMGSIEEQLQEEEDRLVREEVDRLSAEQWLLRDDDEANTEALLDGMLPESLPPEPGLSVTLLAMFEPGPNAALCSTGILKASDWGGGSAAPIASSTRATWAPAWGMGDLVRSNAQFLGLLAVLAHLESLADEANNIRRNLAKAAETGLGVNQMINHVGHTATVHMTDQYAAVNAAAIAAAQEQMKEHGSKRLENGARKRLREQPDLLAMTGLVVTNDTPLPVLMCAEVRVRAVVNAEKLLADPAKRELVKDARTSLKLPAEGTLSFQQKRDLSYVTLAVVNAEKLLADPAKLQLVKDARAALGLPAEGGLAFKQKRDLSYVTLAVVNAEKLLGDPTKRDLVKDARAALGLPAEGGLSFTQKRDLSFWTRTSVSVPTLIRNVTQQIGAGRVLEHQALRPTHTQTQFAMALVKLSDNKPVKMHVNWKGIYCSRKTLTGELFVDIETSFLTKHVAIDRNLLGGASAASGQGDVASWSIVDVLCAMANIVSVAAQDICDAVFATGHTHQVYTEMNSIVGQAVDQQLPPLPVFADRHSLDAATFDAIKTRLLTHFNVSVARIGPGGSTKEKKAKVSSTKLQYRNARRLMFAQTMAQYIAQLKENTHATRAKHYLFWMLVKPLV